MFEYGVVPGRWSFLKQWTAPVARKTKGRDPVYVEISVVKGIIF